MSCMATLVTVFCTILSIVSAFDYIVDSYSNCTDVESVVKNPSRYNVTYFGQFNSTQQCIDECLSKNCDSYSWYNLNNQGNISGSCWGYINNVLWLPYPTIQSNCGRIIYPCKTDYDCSLNGKCNIETGNCTCRPAWNGYYCHFMQLLPANKNAGYLSPYGSYPSTSWGGSIQFDNITNTYIMLVAEMEYNCGINSWRTNSEIVFAETSNNNWNSQYIKKSVILYPFAHSPDIIYAPDTNEYVLIHVRNTSAIEPVPPCTICVNGTTAKGCNVDQTDSETTALLTISPQDFASGYDINKWSSPILLEHLGKGDSNFAAVINKNGSLVGMTRGDLILASNWKDNRTYQVHKHPFPDLTGEEDYYVYKDCNGYYHCLFHNIDPNFNQGLCGGHAYSIDGINWQYGGVAFNNIVEFTDDTRFTFTRRERPHLIFDVNDGCTPIALTSAATYYSDKSYTLLQPIKH